ncbi:MAG TPA: DUF3379 family protein [Gammaproteobacteria bacterium]
MDCTDIRERIEADPAHLDEATVAHLDACTACTAYAERVASAEWLINEALRFDVAALKQQAASPKPSGAVVVRYGKWSVGVAAAVVAGIAVWFGVSLGPGTDQTELTAEVVQHWYEEPGSWVTTDVQVSPASLEQVISGQARIDVTELGLLSYAQSCYVRGQWVPHLVLQGREGPVMLLLLPHERVDEPLPLELPEEGLSGVIVPHGNGSIAIMGENAEPMEPIRDRINDTVEWSI